MITWTIDSKKRPIYWGNSSIEHVKNFYKTEIKDLEQRASKKGEDAPLWLFDRLGENRISLNNIATGTEEEFEAIEKAFWVSECKETTAEVFDEMLGALPPLRVFSFKGGFTFLMREFQCGNYTEQFLKKGNKYYRKIVDVGDTSTYIFGGKYARGH